MFIFVSFKRVLVYSPSDISGDIAPPLGQSVRIGRPSHNEALWFGQRLHKCLVRRRGGREAGAHRRKLAVVVVLIGRQEQVQELCALPPTQSTFVRGSNWKDTNLTSRGAALLTSRFDTTLSPASRSKLYGYHSDPVRSKQNTTNLLVRTCIHERRLQRHECVDLQLVRPDVLHEGVDVLRGRKVLAAAWMERAERVDEVEGNLLLLNGYFDWVGGGRRRLC